MPSLDIVSHGEQTRGRHMENTGQTWKTTATSTQPAGGMILDEDEKAPDLMDVDIKQDEEVDATSLPEVSASSVPEPAEAADGTQATECAPLPETNDPYDFRGIGAMVIPANKTLSQFLQHGVKTTNLVAVNFRRAKMRGLQADMTETALRKRYDVLRDFLPWLEEEVDMTPKLRDESSIHLALKFLFDPTYGMPPQVVEMAKRIYQRFEDEAWGDDGTETPAASHNNNNNNNNNNNGGVRDPSPEFISSASQAVKRPPKNHRIWGTRGIMHGSALKPGSQFGIVVNPDYRHEKKNAMVFGANGLIPGQWYAYRLLALFHGAHGQLQAGISFNQHLGAIAVVSGSSSYAKMDLDFGEYMWYSADNSRDNVDTERTAPDSAGTKALLRSIQTKRPVRVLRKFGDSPYAPKEGYRYDGLYLVEEYDVKRNSQGGLFKLFKLVRCPDQTPLSECMRFPTAQQLRDFALIHDRY